MNEIVVSVIDIAVCSLQIWIVLPVVFSKFDQYVFSVFA